MTFWKPITVPRREWPLLAAVFLDLAGFGMAFFDIQLRAEELRAEWWVIWGLLSSYSIVQLVISPWWGRLSDRIGRKPVLIACTALSIVSMLVYGLTLSLWGILLSRILAGFAAANVVVGQAYIADITTPEERPASMGRISAALLAGLIAGPAIGGAIADHWGGLALGLSAAAASALSLIWIVVGVPHRPPTERREPGAKHLVFDFRLLNAAPGLARLLTIAIVGWFVLACLEGTFARLLHQTIGAQRTEPSLVFSYESLLAAAMGMIIGTLAARWTSGAILRAGYVLQGVGLALTPLATNLAVVFLASTLYAVGVGIANPTINALTSELVPEDRQGELFGLLQAMRALGFILGPGIGNYLFEIAPGLPYFFAGGVSIAAATLVSIPRLRKPTEAVAI